MFSYQKLQNPQPLEEEEEDTHHELVLAPRSARRFGRSRRYWSWRRPKLRVASLLRRAVRGNAVRIRAAVRKSAGKVMRRFKEAGPLAGELFAGNYLFMQVNPTVARTCLEKSLFRPLPETMLRKHQRARS